MLPFIPLRDIRLELFEECMYAWSEECVRCSHPCFISFFGFCGIPTICIQHSFQIYTFVQTSTPGSPSLPKYGHFWILNKQLQLNVEVMTSEQTSEWCHCGYIQLLYTVYDVTHTCIMLVKLHCYCSFTLYFTSQTTQCYIYSTVLDSLWVSFDAPNQLKVSL